MFDRLNHRNVGIGKHEIAAAEIFSENTDSQLFFIGMSRARPLAPIAQITLPGRNPESRQYFIPELVFFKIKRNIINTFYVWRRNDIFFFHTAHKRDFLFASLIKRHMGAAENKIRMKTNRV